MRLNKYIVELGICSRRKADELISAKKVLVNGSIAALGQILNEGDEVKIDSQTYKFNPDTKSKIYIALNKPASFITSFETGSQNLKQLLRNPAKAVGL